MTDLEVSKALALVIGFTEADFLYSNKPVEHSGLQIYKVCGDATNPRAIQHIFDYRDWNTIGFVAARYGKFPTGRPGHWYVPSWGEVYCLDNPQKAIAMAVINGSTTLIADHELTGFSNCAEALLAEWERNPVTIDFTRGGLTLPLSREFNLATQAQIALVQQETPLAPTEAQPLTDDQIGHIKSVIAGLAFVGQIEDTETLVEHTVRMVQEALGITETATVNVVSINDVSPDDLMDAAKACGISWHVHRDVLADFARRVRALPYRSDPVPLKGAACLQRASNSEELYTWLRGQHWSDKTLTVVRAKDLPLGTQTFSLDMLDQEIRFFKEEAR